MRDGCCNGVCTRHSRNKGEGVFRLPLEVKDGFTEKENDFVDGLVGEERRRQESIRVGRAYSSCTGVTLLIEWWAWGRAGGLGWRTGGVAGDTAESQLGFAIHMQVDLSSSCPFLWEHLPFPLSPCWKARDEWWWLWSLITAEQTRGMQLTQTDPDSLSQESDRGQRHQGEIFFWHLELKDRSFIQSTAWS